MTYQEFDLKDKSCSVNGKLPLLFFSSQGLYQYDTSKPCIDRNLITLLNETLLGLNGGYQNYIIFGNLLGYTVMKNELHFSCGSNLSISENLGVLANHQNHPLLYGFIFDDIVILTSTLTVTSVSNITSSSTGVVTMTTSSSITTFNNTSIYSSTNTVTSNISTFTSVTMTSTPSTTDPKRQSKLLKDVIPYVVGTCISIVVSYYSL